MNRLLPAGTGDPYPRSNNPHASLPSIRENPMTEPDTSQSLANLPDALPPTFRAACHSHAVVTSAQAVVFCDLLLALPVAREDLGVSAEDLAAAREALTPLAMTVGAALLGIGVPLSFGGPPLPADLPSPETPATEVDHG